jgi:hypothetical protein
MKLRASLTLHEEHQLALALGGRSLEDLLQDRRGFDVAVVDALV